jgi:Cu-Zn family superoxide dismutase
LLAGAAVLSLTAGVLADDGDWAVAVVHPTAGQKAEGVVWFIESGDTVKVVADIQGLAHNTEHGFHIHEWGDCTDPAAKSAGGHYNPQGHPHAAPTAEMHHAGDLGNIQSDAQGHAHLEMTLHDVCIRGGENPIIGRAVIVHAKADDLKTQPTGDAGDRVGCGVIGLAQPRKNGP